MSANYRKIINNFNKKNILVIGDLILDKYILGTVTRISPEAPVPVVLEKESFFMPGGAASVANNLSTLGATVTIVGRIGDDLEAHLLKNELSNRKVSTKGIFVDKAYPTVLKTRIIAQHHQQIVRLDREKTNNGEDTPLHAKMIKFVRSTMDDYDAVIISDYGKGLITPGLVSSVCAAALAKNKIITVDPKVEHFNYYRQVTAITPNLKETENAIRNIKITSSSAKELDIQSDKLIDDKTIDQAGAAILKYLDLESLLMTLGEKGMRLFEKNKPPVAIKTKAREVFDVTGAGDAVISVFTLALTAGATKAQAADIANSAAGIVVGKMGAVSVTTDELLEVIKE